jgi:TIR domain
MSRIFISRAGWDIFEAEAIRRQLAYDGWDDVFLDLDPERGIAAAERWERALHAAVMRCEAVIFLISKHWLESDWCDKEYYLASGLNKKLFAIVIDFELTIDNLPAKYTNTWQVVDMVHGDLQIFRVSLPGSQEEKHVSFSRDGLRRLKRGLEKAGLDAKFFAWPPQEDPERAPYRGLKALDAGDAGIFFGRDAKIVGAIDALRGLRRATPPRLWVILGASGAGKSSFLRAGLLPRLARDDSNFLVLPPIRPERAALFGDNGLLAAFTRTFSDRVVAELRTTIKAGAQDVRKLLAEWADAAFRRTLADADTARPPSIVISIDQAEELFRPEGKEEGVALLSLLRVLMATDDPSVIVVFAIRSVSYDDLECAEPLKGVTQRTMPLPPMLPGDYKDVIEGPARRVREAGGKLSIEPRLTERLLQDLDARGGGSDALPLLAFTLEQLYREHGRSGVLRVEDYEAFGGLRGAINAAVERAFERANSNPNIPSDRLERESLLRRGLIPWLASVDPSTKSPRRNIARRSEIPADALPLIDLLVEERLLSAAAEDRKRPFSTAAEEAERPSTIEQKPRLTATPEQEKSDGYS